MLDWLYHLFGQQSPRQRERAGYEARIKGLNENILSLSDRMHGIEAERDALREQVQAYGKDALAQAKRVDSALRERDEAIHLYNGLQTRFDAIRVEIETLRSNPVPATDGTVKKSRSRAKPTTQE